jgi:HEAT repeat protein
VVRIAKGSGSLKARKQAVFFLGQSESAEGRRAVHDIIGRSDTPEEVRDNGIFALGQNGEPEDLRKLRALYPELPDKLRKQMVFAVSQSGDPEALRWTISVALNDNESHDVRKHALFSAGQGGASMRELIGLWDKIDDRKLREQLLFVYSQREESEATDKLVSVAKSDPDRDLRKKAMFWLSQKDDERAARFIREVLKP